MRRSALVLGLAALYLGATVGAARTVEILPHRALYDMTLARVDSGSGVIGVDGRMLVEVSESCDGWTVSHHSSFQVLSSRRPTVRIVNDVTSWESKDGRSYRFVVKNRINDQTERLEGAARLGATGRVGAAEFTLPEPKTVRLPAGTVFPIAHARALVAAAARGDRIYSKRLFDGLSTKGPIEINVVIGKVIAIPTAAEPDLAPIAGRRSWRIHVAFFQTNSRKSEPDHEVSLRFYENGIEDDLLLNFQEFKLRARARRIEALARASCG